MTKTKDIARLKSLRQNQIYNHLNSMHYQDTPLRICLQHKSHKRCTYLQAKPDPVSDESATATWIQGDFFPANFSAFDLVKIVLTSGRGSYEFKPEKYHLGDHVLNFTVPDLAVEADFRKQQRFLCAEKHIEVTLTQNAVVFKGQLLDYAISGILINLESGAGMSFSWLNNNLPAMLTIIPDGDPVYTGHVNLTPRGNGQYLVVPNLDATPRYTQKKFRARRQELVPSPDLIFDHPITGKSYSLKICDLSGLGFSIEEEKYRTSLIPGLLLKEAKISFSGGHYLACVVQVVHFQPDEENPKYVKIGFAILHINVKDHLHLINLIQQAQDPQASVSSQINTSDLFEFFFETGFLYPGKYVEIASRRKEMTKAYLALYEKGVDVSRHFVYQHAGQILGHFSSLRVYRKTWLSQHHAALKSQRAGLHVVRTISEYLNDSYQLDPTNIKYTIGYYQAANRFPKRYFGDYVGHLNDQKKTTLDHFSYIKEARKFSGDVRMFSEGWSCVLATASDLVEFNAYYDEVHGGMLPDALDLLPESFDDQTLSETYTENGLSRHRALYALRSPDGPKAIIDVQETDFGLNLSEITNTITVYLIDPDPDYFTQICYAIYDLAMQNNKMSDPVMMFPNTYLKSCKFTADKEYIMWALNIPNGMESYMSWMNRYCR